jgi:hypothetical protein
MKRIARKICIVLFVAISFASPAQETDPQRIIESILESHLDKIEDQTDVALIIEDLEGFLENPSILTPQQQLNFRDYMF